MPGPPVPPQSNGSREECWLVSNGAAGNERQVQALGAYMPWPTRPLKVSPRAPWRWAGPRVLPGADRAWASSVRRLLRPPWPRLVIGCGRDAALFTRLLRQRSGGACRSVQILDPRIDPRHWDLVIAPRHDGLEGENVLRPLGSLHPVDERWLHDARRAWAPLQALPRPRIAVLLGGPRGRMTLDAEYARTLGRALLARVRSEGGSVLLLASRRTPSALFTGLRDMLTDVPGLRWGNDSDGDNPYAGVLGWADRLVVTPDSVNMLSEACATGRPVHTLVTRPITGKLGRLHNQLRARGLLHAVDAFTADKQTPLRETADVAQSVRARLRLTGRDQNVNQAATDF